MDERVVEQQLKSQGVAAGRMPVETLSRSVALVDLRPSAQQRHGWIFGKKGDLPAEPIREAEIILVEPCHKISPSELKPTIQRSGKTSIILMDYDKTWVVEAV